MPSAAGDNEVSVSHSCAWTMSLDGDACRALVDSDELTACTDRQTIQAAGSLLTMDTVPTVARVDEARLRQMAELATEPATSPAVTLGDGNVDDQCVPIWRGNLTCRENVGRKLGHAVVLARRPVSESRRVRGPPRKRSPPASGLQRQSRSRQVAAEAGRPPSCRESRAQALDSRAQALGSLPRRERPTGMLDAAEGRTVEPRPFVLHVNPIEPKQEEMAAWKAFLTKINAAGWAAVPGKLADAREGAADWETVLKLIDTDGDVHGTMDTEGAVLADAIGAARAAHLVAQLARRVLLARAECLEGLGRWHDCVQCYSEVDNDGEDAELYFKRGCSYYYAGNTGAADSNFELALVKDPGMQVQIDSAKASPAPTPGGPRTPGEIGPGMIGPMRPGESRPAYDAAFDASTLNEDAQVEQAIQASLKEDHFSASGPAEPAPAPNSTPLFDLPAVVEQLEAGLSDCLNEASQMPQCARQPWSAMVPEECEALTLLGWTEQNWETAACKGPWAELTAEEQTTAQGLGFTEASWVWMSFREWLPKIVSYFMLRKGQPTWEESMTKRRAEGVTAVEEYETVHRRLIDISTRVLVEAIGRRYQWASGALRHLLDRNQEGLYTCQKWSKSTSKLEEQGAPHLHAGAVNAFVESHGAARIAEALEGLVHPDDSVPILELLVLVHASAEGIDGTDDLSRSTERVVAACVGKVRQHVSDDHGGTILMLQQLLKLKLGKAAGVQLWKDLCVRGLGSEKYLVRLSALEQLVKLADSADAGLSAEDFTEWVAASKVYDQVFGEKMPLDKPEYKQRAKVFFRHTKLVHSDATFVHWTNLLLPKLSASVVQDLIVEVCLDKTIPIELWIQLVKRLTAITKGQSTGYAGDEQCQQSVLAFVPILFANVELVTSRYAAVCDIAELLKAALDGLAALPDKSQETDRARVLLLNAFSDMWNYVDDDDRFQQSSLPASEPEPEEHMPPEDSIARLAELEQKQKDGIYVPNSILNRLRDQVDQVAKESPGRKKVAFAGETFDAEDATKNSSSKDLIDLSRSPEDGSQQVHENSQPIVPELNLSIVDGNGHDSAEASLSLAEEQVLEECMQILAGNEAGASRGQVIRLIQDIRRTAGVVSTDAVVTKMFDTPMESVTSSSADSIRAERLRQEREAAKQSEPTQFGQDLGDTVAFPALPGIEPSITQSQSIKEFEDDHEQWGTFVCSGPGNEDWLAEARNAQRVAKDSNAATDMRQTCTQASRALDSIKERLASLEEKIGAESAGNVVYAVKTELYDMRAHAWFGIGSWKRCIEDCENYLDLVANTEIEELSCAAARRKFDEGEEDDEDESKLTPDEARAKRKRSTQNCPVQMKEDPEIIKQLMQMGFSRNSCRKASRASRDLESATSWLLQHSQDDDFDDDPGDPDDSDKENEVRRDLLDQTDGDRDVGITRSDGTVLTCAVTYNDTTEWVGMATCGHKFSTVAWQDWIRTHKDKPARLVCMGQACHVPIPTHFVLDMVEPGDRETVKKVMAGQGSSSTSSGAATTVATPSRSFHESLRDLRVRYARLCVADLHRQMQGESGCTLECRPVAVEFLLATLQSYSITEVDAERRGTFIEEVNVKNEWGTTLVEMLLDETVAFAKSATGAAQQEGVRLRLELLTLLHRFCRPLLLTWEMTSRLWNGLEVLECRSLLFPWMRASLTHTAAVEPASEHAFACFTPDVRSEVLARLLDLSASLLDVQAYHLFQNVMIGINADAGKLKIGGWCAKESAITGDDYCASSAMPAGHDGVELLEFNVSGTNSITGVIAGAGSTTKELHGSRAVPKGQDGAKLVGTWVKVLQHGQVWKDGQLTRCYSQAGSTATYDIRYVDGCVQRRNLQSLRSWMLIDPLDTQMPMVVNITAVTDGDLLGLDVLWRAAVQSPNEEVSMLARSLLFRLYTQMGDTLCSEETIQLALDTADPGLAETICDSIGVPHSLSCKALVLNQNEWDSTFQWLQERQMDGTLDAEAKTPLTLEQAQRATDALPADLRVRLVDQVEAGLRESIEMLESGNAEIAEQMIRRQIDIVQSFVNRYQTNSKARQHAVSRRGRPLTVKVLYGTIEAHENMTCGDLHTKVCAHLHLVTKTPLEIAKGDQVVGSLPNSSATTLAVAQVENGFEIRERKDKIGERPVVEASVVLDHFCPGELLAQSDKWFELLFDLLDRAISTATRAAIWHLLMSIPTMAFEKNEVSQFRIRWTKTNFLRTVYDLQVVEAIIDPPNEDSGTAAEDWRRSFISNGDHFKEFIKFVTAMESHGANLDDSMVCAHCLPVAMRVLYFCICSALPDSPNVTRGLSRSFSSSSATAVFEALENTLGSDYFSVLVKHVCRLMAKAVAARQAQATIFGAQVLLAVAAQPDATVAVLHVAVPLLVNLLVTCTEDMVRAEAVDVLHCIALVSEEAGLYIMDKVRRSPPNADCCAICEQYFELLQQLQRSLSTTRQDLAASLVTDLQSTYAADFDHHPDGEKPTRCRIDLLRDIFEQDVSIRDTTVTVELIDLLWSRYLMAIARDDEDQTPVCCSAGGRHAVCALLDQSVASTVGSVEESSHFSFLVQLVSEFVSATRAPMQRDGESPEFDYDPEKRTGYGDSTTAKLRNSTNLAGLTNQGNTCYMNSVLQQLYGSREVRRAVLDAPLGLRVQVENYYSASLKSGAEVILQAPGMEPLCVSGEFGLGFNGRSELTQTLPEGRYTVRVSCEGKVSSQEHDLCTGVHLILLSDQEGQIAQTVRSQPIVTEVHRCFSFLEYGASACVDTSSLCNSLHACQSPSGASYLEYPIRSQNDAAEFLGKIVDTLGEDMKGSKAAASLKDLLTSTKVVEKQCLECKTVSHTVEDHAVLLSVTIETPELEKLGSLEQALESAAKPEILSGTNAVDCEKCHKKCPTSRSSLAKKLPRVLLVHLTRFVQNMYGEYHKANHRVTFPQRLDMRPYTTTSADREVSEPPAWYELTGVVLHSGTQRAGHYTSLVKHGGQWITFDDQHASPFEGDLEDVCFGGEEEITQSWGTNRTSKREKSKNAYILMYQLEGESADGSSCDSSADLDVKRKATPKMDSAAEGETPDPATWAARRNLREALQEHKQTLQRQQRLFNPELLGLIRSLCTLGLGEPGLAESEHAPEVEPEPAPEVEPEPAPEVEPEPSPEVEPEPAPEVEPTTDVASGTEPDEEPEQPTGLQSRLLQLGLTTFVHIVCRYRDHSNTAAWSTLLAHWLSQPKHLSSACWLVLRVGGEDGWAEADAVLKPAVPKSYAARNGFVNVLRAAVDLVRVNRGEREDAVEAAAIVAVSVEHPGCVPSESNDETAATASTPSDLETVIDAGMEAELATAIAVKDAHSAPELNHDDQALNTALASVRKQLAKHDVNTATVASGGRRNAVAPGTAPPVPPLMLMDRSADADPLAPIDVKIENNDCKPMQLYGQPSPDREWRFLQNINPGSQFPFEKNQMSTFKGVVPGVAEYTWKRKPTEEGPLTFNKRNYTGFSPDNASASAVTAAGHSEPRAHSPPSGVASKDAGSGSDATPMGVGTSHKAEPTPEEEAIISQATEMLCCGRQAVLSVIEKLKIANKTVGPEIVIDTLLTSL